MARFYTMTGGHSSVQTRPSLSLLLSLPTNNGYQSATHIVPLFCRLAGLQTDKSWVYALTTSHIGYYLEYFKAAIFTTIVPGPTVLECVGCMGNQHSFLEVEGSYTCSKCQGILCRHCLWDLKVLDRASAQCMPCAQSLIDHDDDYPMEGKMRAAIRDKQQCVPVRATYADIVQLYGTLVLDDTVGMFSASFEAVTYPLCPPTMLHLSSDRITQTKQ
jgi:hypothetical protein